jgi:hypothetical protein
VAALNLTVSMVGSRATHISNIFVQLLDYTSSLGITLTTILLSCLSGDAYSNDVLFVKRRIPSASNPGCSSPSHQNFPVASPI